MSDKSHASDQPAPAGDGPFRLHELPSFQAFEQKLDAALIELEKRWSSWSTPGTMRTALQTKVRPPRKPR